VAAGLLSFLLPETKDQMFDDILELEKAADDPEKEQDSRVKI
jgi:hypothetical protein